MPGDRWQIPDTGNWSVFNRLLRFAGRGLALLFVLSAAGLGYAADPGGWLWSDNVQWGGYAKLRLQQQRVDDRTVYQLVGAGAYTDYNGQVRLTHRRYFSDAAVFDLHYEIAASGGDSRKKQTELAAQFPDLSDLAGQPPSVPKDRRRLMNLSTVITEDTDHVVYHRIDRLNLSLQRDWGDLRIGRQAITWGNGLLFNPMDLFNPFSPTDIEREYKTGDDMIAATLLIGNLPEIQVLCVPRRHPETGTLEAEQSALAAKAHLIKGETEFDLLAAANYGDHILAAGARGYLFDAAWRMDVVYTVANPRWEEENFVSLVANLDYSWTWQNHNWYGLIELYHNGLGQDDYPAALADDHIRERFDRGEVFVLGSWYAAAHAHIELHPLVNAYTTALVNLNDFSGITQPRMTWDATQNLMFTIGADLHWGRPEAEYGGFSIPGTPFDLVPPDSVYIRANCYF